MTDLVNPIVDVIGRLWACCSKQTRYVYKLQQNTNLLRKALVELKEARNDLQRKVDEEEADTNEPKRRTDQVGGWLQRVLVIEEEVEVMLKKSNEQLLLGRAARCLPTRANYKLGKSIARKIPLVDDLMKNGNFEQVTYRLPPPSAQDINSVVATVGMESMFDKLWRLINADDDQQPVRILGLHGHGGVGKTTLLEKINNQFNTIGGEHDHLVIFVVVSKPINVQAIQTQIGKRLRLSLEEDERSRAHAIFNLLRNRKFVMLLDDIWERVDLPTIGIPTHSSSKIIFTTRSVRVCGLMEATHTFQVECLPWDKAWSLFQEKVGEKALNSFPGARELAKDVAKECGGLPLALITIGRAMSTKKSVEEWRDAITTLRSYASKFEGMGDQVLPRLKLSYDNLSDETEKSCFCYCALFPEDHPIKITQLVDLWIAEGFLDGFDNNLDEARDRGHTIIESLKSSYLLESSYVDNHANSDEDNHVKMHDVIRDLALWIVNDDCSSSSSTTTSNKILVTSSVSERWRNAERIFLNARDRSNNNDLELELEEPPTCPNLRTLLIERFNANMPQIFFEFAPSLRVLDVSKISRKLPASIGELYELQYLNLSNSRIKEIPVELRKLVKLKFLDLSSNIFLDKIPPGVIANLSELQVLKLAGSWLEDLDWGEMGRLKQLQDVTLTISRYLALDELLCNQKLRRICTFLVLMYCANLKSISLPPPSLTPSLIASTYKGDCLGNLISLKEVQISRCVELEELILLFPNDEEGETNTTTTTSATGLPISKLEVLDLGFLPRLNNIVWGEKYHHYMSAAQQQQQQQLHYLHYASPFQNLYKIEIQWCDALKDLTWVVYVENLKNLWVYNCKELETITELGDDHGLEEGASGGCSVFRRLETLKIGWLPNLKSICSLALVFPSIKTISILECPELKKLPLDSRSNINNTLQLFESEQKWWSELQWEDESTKSKFLPYLIKGTSIDE